MKTETNSSCMYCKIRFNTTLENLSMCEICGCVSHSSCVKNLINTCCYENSIKEEDVKDKYEQKYIDLLFLKKSDYVVTKKDFLRMMLFRLPVVLTSFGLLCCDYFVGNITKKYNKTIYNFFIKSLRYVLNINSKIVNQEKLITDSKIIYITNHTSFHDSLILQEIIPPNALASASVLKDFQNVVMSKYTNALFVKRGETNKKTSIVEQINNFIEKYGNITICPQGLLGRYNIINKFRTSAFRTKYEIQPIILNYKQNVSSLTFFEILCFPKIDVEIKIMDKMNIKENESVEEYSERVRQIIAKEYNFGLSNVISKDIKD